MNVMFEKITSILWACLNSVYRSPTGLSTQFLKMYNTAAILN